MDVLETFRDYQGFMNEDARCCTSGLEAWAISDVFTRHCGSRHSFHIAQVIERAHHVSLSRNQTGFFERTMRSISIYPTFLHSSRASVLSLSQRPWCRARGHSTTADAHDITSLSPRWLSEVKSRIGKCIQFGISSSQTVQAASILKEITADWRELMAGSEGFLTAKKWRGLYRQEVVWGEMVAFPSRLAPTMADAECLVGRRTAW